MYRTAQPSTTLVVCLLLFLSACGGGGDSGPPPPPPNSPPTANAGTDQVANEGEEVTLSGSGQDNDGTIQSYSWTQISGPDVDLTNASEQTATFTAPELSNGDSDLVFRLTVTDNDGATNSDDVTIMINSIPSANAGSDQIVDEGAVVQLDGSASVDDDGSIVSYAWTQTPNDAPLVKIENSDSVQATFVAPEVLANTVFDFQLQVTDDDEATSTSSVSVTVINLAQIRGIAIVGLGESILVTNIQLVTISGVAESDIEISKITYQNLTSKASGDATGTTEWSAEITLQEGDNQLKFSIVTADGKTGFVETTLTYFAALDFTTNLVLSSDITYIGDGFVNVIATIGTDNPNDPSVSLVRVNEEGEDAVVIEEMLDTGTLPDEIQEDDVYTGEFGFQEIEIGFYCYRVRVTDSQIGTYNSEQQCIWLTEHYSTEDVNAAASLADEVKSLHDMRLEAGDTNVEAAGEVTSQFEQDERVGVIGWTDDGGVWWVSSEGILGAYHPIRDDETREGRAENRGANGIPVVSTESSARRISHYPREYLMNRSGYTPLDNQRHLSYADLITDSDTLTGHNSDLVQSHKAMMISPYRDRDPAVFGSADDFYGAWQEIKNSNSCGLIPEVEVANFGVTLEHFKGWDVFGYVHIATHGDNYYRGLLSAWLEIWGPDDFLVGGLSLVGVDTGIEFARTLSNDLKFEEYEDELQFKRVAIGPGGTIIALPSFFRKYLGTLPNSIIVVSSCRSGHNNSLFNVLVSKGAGAIVGFDDYVNTYYAHNTTKEIARSLIEGATFGEAVDNAVAAYGSAGPSNAKLVTRGNSNLRLGSGVLTNGGFETGTLSPWQKHGDGRIIRRLGNHQPTSGKFMGIISTGLGFTTSSGSLSQFICFSPSQSSITFRWNLLSEEFLEYCDTGFDDAFRVDVCQDSDCQSVFETSINDLCANPGVLIKESIGFDRGDVYGTGWRDQQINVAPYAGSGAELRFFSTDVGDSVFDTAILLDDVSIE